MGNKLPILPTARKGFADNTLLIMVNLNLLGGKLNAQSCLAFVGIRNHGGSSLDAACNCRPHRHRRGRNWTLGGYCSPNTGGSCTPYAFATPLSIGGTSYGQFYVNSNGTVSLGSIRSIPDTAGEWGHVDSPNSALCLRTHTRFRPRFVDGPGVQDFFGGGGYDGTYVSDTSINPSGFAVSFYGCTDPLHCGPRTIDLVQNATFSQSSYDSFGLSRTIAASSQLNDPTATPEQNFASGKAYFWPAIRPSFEQIYTITLSELVGGFQVDYFLQSRGLANLGHLRVQFADCAAARDRAATKPNLPVRQPRGIDRCCSGAIDMGHDAPRFCRDRDCRTPPTAPADTCLIRGTRPG